MRPSGRITTVPSSNDGSFAASRASRLPAASVETRPLVEISNIARAPPPVVPINQGLKPLTEFSALAVIVLRVAGGGVALWAPLLEGTAGAAGPQPTRTSRTSRLATRRCTIIATPPVQIENPAPMVAVEPPVPAWQVVDRWRSTYDRVAFRVSLD